MVNKLENQANRELKFFLSFSEIFLLILVSENITDMKQKISSNLLQQKQWMEQKFDVLLHIIYGMKRNMEIMLWILNVFLKKIYKFFTNLFEDPPRIAIEGQMSIVVGEGQSFEENITIYSNPRVNAFAWRKDGFTIDRSIGTIFVRQSVIGGLKNS